MKAMTKKYYFSVEGKTEKWYLDWLQNAINTANTTTYKVVFDSKVEKNPLARVKAITIISKTEIVHICDKESNDEDHVKAFQTTLESMKKAQKQGKHITYKLGYSNFTFELWIILHKQDCNTCFDNRKQYLQVINKAYHKSFNSLDEYKREDNFKQLLMQLDLSDVNNAINRAHTIMQNNKQNECVLQRYAGFTFYKNNPSTSLGEYISRILTECGYNLKRSR